MATSIDTMTTCTIINCASAEVGSSVRSVLSSSRLCFTHSYPWHRHYFLSLLLLLLLHDCCCLFGDKQHCINFSYHSAPTLLQQLTNHIHPITSHCTDQAAYLCLSMLLLLHSTQPPPALVLLCLYAPWGVFISKLITLGGLLAMVPACYLSLCCEFHSATRYCYSRQLYQQGAIFPK